MYDGIAWVDAESQQGSGRLLPRTLSVIIIYRAMVMQDGYPFGKRSQKMVALSVGVVLVILAVLACLPGVFGWWGDVLAFLRGSLPVMAALIGLVAVFIGVADIKDRREAKKEEEEEAKKSSSEESEKKPE
ncbi:MAG: hypothetical protein ABFC75_03335 [Rectinema sp.]